MRWALVVGGLALAGGACAHFPLNSPLGPNDSRGGYKFENLNRGVANTNSLLVCLSFSGGGTRAAAFSLGVLRTLRDTRIEGESKRLIDEVDVVSAVSGGAFTAAYFGLYGEERLFRDFEPILQRDFTSELLRRGLLCPYNGIRLLSPWFERSDLAAELYGETIYGKKTYADLQARGRPFVVLNATNLSLGQRFEFTQAEFDLLGSALRDFPVGRAVAASSAFPFLLTPVTLANYGAASLAPDASATAADRVLRDRERARRSVAADRDHHPFVHLVDGGIIDNLGLGYLLDSYRDGFIRDLLNAQEVSTLVFIVVNARNRAPEDMDATACAPGVANVIVSCMGASIDCHTGELARSVGALQTAEEARSGVKVYTIEVNLEDLPDEARRERLLAIGTDYALSPEEIHDVADAGAELLRRSATFGKLVEALK
jgi:NTE family protein